MPLRVFVALSSLALLSMGGLAQDEATDGTLLELGSPIAADYSVQIESLLDTLIVSQGAENREDKHRTIVKEEYRQRATNGRTQIDCETRTEERNRGGPITKPESGRAFVVTGTGPKRVVTARDREPVDPDFADHLGRWTDFFPLVPGKVVQVGDTWSVEITGLGDALQLGAPIKAMKFDCTFQEETEGVAVIAFSGSHEGTESQVDRDVKSDSKVSLNLKGTLTVDVAAKRPVNLKVSGNFSLETALSRIEENIMDRTRKTYHLGTINVQGERVISTVGFSYPK